MSVSVDPEQIRAELDAIGDRRQALGGQEDDLRKDTREALRKAKGVVPRAEAARRVGLNRSTVYELYLGEDEHAAHGRPAEGERGQAMAG